MDGNDTLKPREPLNDGFPNCNVEGLESRPHDPQHNRPGRLRSSDGRLKPRGCEVPGSRHDVRAPRSAAGGRGGPEHRGGSEAPEEGPERRGESEPPEDALPFPVVVPELPERELGLEGEVLLLGLEAPDSAVEALPLVRAPLCRGHQLHIGLRVL